MTSCCLQVVQRFIGLHLKTVPISALRCERTRVALQEGWGGRTIDVFPPHRFYRMFHDGAEQEARAAMADWYYQRFVDGHLCEVAKSAGGMHGGSLHRELERLHLARGIALDTTLRNADASLVREAIRARVQERFELFQSIRRQGYACSWDYIAVKENDGSYELTDGHHRVAALDVCGHRFIQAALTNPITLRIAARLGRKLTTGPGYQCPGKGPSS
ncbi:MAG: hypothetical protein MUC88_26240 [Planctomycetes bacterium]|jgi:hypothetical protein|nr:hypothetical protein [Planctomycetota bacterium]